MLELVAGSNDHSDALSAQPSDLQPRPSLSTADCDHLHASSPIALDLYVTVLYGSRHLTKFAGELVNGPNLYRKSTEAEEYVMW